MDSFPSTFVAVQVHINIAANRLKKIEQDLKCLRKKIVDSFQGQTRYHSEVTHNFLPDLSEEEQKHFYKIIKEELEERKFTVRGKINNDMISLVIFANTPRTHEMDRILKAFSDKDIKLDNTFLNSSNSSVSSNTPSSDHGSSDFNRPLSPAPVLTKAQQPRKRSSRTLSTGEPPSQTLDMNDVNDSTTVPVIYPVHIVNSTSLPLQDSTHVLDMSPLVVGEVNSTSDPVNEESSEINMDFIKRKLSQAKSNKTSKK